MTTATAKFEIKNVTNHHTGAKSIIARGEYSPFERLEMTITNPSLLHFFEPGKKYYMQFTKAVEDGMLADGGD